jgi:cytochrome b6-f complex iron-sulfur subunit
MADKKKMSVAEMLAAARKADSKGGGAAPAAAVPVSETPAEKPKPAAAAKPAAKSDGSRPSVADILAMARQGSPTAEPAKPAAEAKPKPKPAPAAAKATAVKEPPSRPADTQSILAAARSFTKPGPMSKAEAAAKGKAAPEKKAVKPAIIVPPMPVKPDYAKPKSAAQTQADRRTIIGALAIGFTALGVTFLAWTLAGVRFMFPNVLREPPSKFKVGFPDSFPPGSVDERFKAQFGVWIVNAEYNGEMQLVALKTVCTHLGCTPNWLDAEQKFKCPCHGSGFYKDGINFEGPAPRPLERYAIAMADDGQVEVDKSRIFQEEMGQWADPSVFYSRVGGAISC